MINRRTVRALARRADERPGWSWICFASPGEPTRYYRFERTRQVPLTREEWDFETTGAGWDRVRTLEYLPIEGPNVAVLDEVTN